MRGCTAFVARLGLLAGLLTTACGGGSGTSGDTLASAAPVASALGLDRFLIFPNPQLMADGRSQIDSLAYAEAYYAASTPAARRTRWPSGRRPMASAAAAAASTRSSSATSVTSATAAA